MLRKFQMAWFILSLLAACGDSATSPAQWIPFKAGKWGFVDPGGAVAIAPKYDYAHCFSEEDVAIVYQDHKCGYLNGDGSWLLSPRYLQCEHMAFGRAPVRANDSGWIFVDWKGTRLTPTVFKEAYPFKPTGTASVEMNDSSWSLLDTNMQAMKFTRVFSYLSEFLIEDTAALACEVVDGKDRCGVIDKQGEYISEVRNVSHVFESGIVIFGEDSATGVLQLPSDTLMKPVFPFLKYAGGRFPSEYRFWVSGPRGRFSLIDRFARVHAVGKWDSVYPIYKSATIVEAKGKFGLVESYSGKILLPAKYASIEESCPGYVLVGKGKTADHLRVFDIAARRFIGGG